MYAMSIFLLKRFEVVMDRLYELGKEHFEV